MSTIRLSTLWLVAASLLLTSAVGCEFLTPVDRSRIDETGATGGGDGGSGDQGGGGMGGAGGGMGGMGGAGGGAPCMTPADCPPTGSECIVATCAGGMCELDFVPAGTATATQTAGDCQQDQCDGNGGTVSAADDTDLPDDSNPCTDDLCTAGTPSNPPVPVGTVCGLGMLCDGNGACVGCVAPSDCPGADTECQQRTCVAGVCGVSFTTAGTPLSMQTAGDCQEDQCDGAGGVISANDDADLPVDGIECTSDVCTAGVPSNPPTAAGAACTQSGGAVCDGSGACVECLAPSDCPGMDTECQTRTCVANVCGVSFTAAGTPVSSQTPGDCQQSQCDGAGGVVSTIDNADLPVDGNQCTDDICTAGVPSNPPLSAGTACNQAGGALCDGAGACVECLAPTDCPGMDTECQTRTCSTGACGVSFTAAGTPISSQTSGDCQQSVCDGAGSVVSVNDDADVPVDINECTDDVCTAGVPSNPPSAPGTACSQGGGIECDGAGVCVECLVGAECPSGVCSGGACQAPTCTDGVANGMETDIDCGGGTCPLCGVGQMCAGSVDCQSGVCTGSVCQPPSVVSTAPADSATGVATSSMIAVMFSTAMDPATLSAQTSNGACTGSMQVSTDGFATCIGFATAAPAMSGGDTIATLTPTPALSYGSTYAIRVTTSATDASGNPLGPQYTSTTGFTTVTPAPGCGTSLVISEVYGAGGNIGAAYRNDFIELHNRGSTPVSVTGWTVQYAASTGTTWQGTALSGTIAPGGYYLVQESSAGATGGLLPTPEASGGIGMGANSGKVALVSSTTLLNGACPLGPTVVDLVGYGPTTDCYEGLGPIGALGNGTSAQRAEAACTDTNDNAADLSVAFPFPQNSASPTNVCLCTANESDAAFEADYCNLQFPATLSVPSSTPTGQIYGRIYEAGVTDPAGAPGGVTAEVGYGPTTLNPTTEGGWQFFPAVFNVQVGNDDEFRGSFTTPATPGTYGYTYRFSLDGGEHWTYCDLNGAGSNAGLTFEITRLGTLTVTP